QGRRPWRSLRKRGEPRDRDHRRDPRADRRAPPERRARSRPAWPLRRPRPVPCRLPSRRPRSATSGRVTYSTPMAWRSWYQPQFPHTRWGSLAAPHRGQTLRGGAETVHALARRLRLFDLDVFFLGTAMLMISLAHERVRSIDCASSLATSLGA